MFGGAIINPGYEDRVKTKFESRHSDVVIGKKLGNGQYMPYAYVPFEEWVVVCRC